MAVGSVRIDLEASTAKFERQMQSFSKKLDKQIGNITRGLKTIGLGATAAAAGLSVLVKSTINTNDQLAKTADKIGTTTEELSKLRFAAELTGVSSNTLDMALQRMTRRLSEATNGTGEAVGALEELNINAQEISQLSLSQQIDLIATRMDGLGSQADRVRIAMKLFDSEGVALVNTLRGGGTALDEYRKKAESLGVVVDTKTAKASENFNDQLTILGAGLKGISQQITASLLPNITRITEKVIRFTTSTEIKDFISVLVKIVRAIEIAIEGIIAGFIALKGVVAVISKDFEKANEEGEKFAKTIDEINRLIKSFDKDAKFTIIKTTKETTEEDDSEKKQVDKFKGFKKQIKDFYKEITDLNTQFADAFKNAFRGLEDALVEFTKSGKLNFKDLADSIINDIARIAIKQAIIAPLVKGTSGLFGGFFSGGKSAEIGGVSSLGSLKLSGARALGGPVTGGSSYLVGERGPEIFSPNSTGRIIPNNKIDTGSGSANGQTNMADVQITINAIDTQTGVSFLLANQDTIEGIINKSLSTNGTTRELI